MSAILISMLSSCNKIEPGPPDPRNYAHCIATFQYARSTLLNGSKSKSQFESALHMTERSLYDTNKVKDTGNLKNSKEIGLAFLERYSNNRVIISKMLKQCIDRQNKDAEFEKFYEDGTLVNMAMEMERQCKGKNCFDLSELR